MNHCCKKNELDEYEIANINPPEAHGAEKIVSILHSIKRLEIDKSGELEIWFDGDEYPSVSTGFIPGSFTRRLIELIEDYFGGKGFDHNIVVDYDFNIYMDLVVFIVAININGRFD